MNPEEKALLEKTYELSKENNKILKSVRRSNRWSAFFKVFYWMIIISISIGAFYYIQPYIDTFMNTYQSIKGDIDNVKSAVDSIQKSN